MITATLPARSISSRLPLNPTKFSVAPAAY